MLTTPPPEFRKTRRPLRLKPSTSAPPAGLTLVSASYNHDVSPVLFLTFDRAIDISAIDGSLIVVDDADDQGLKFAGTGGATVESPNTVQLLLLEIGDATGVGTTLTAAAGNGIVAADDGGLWAGATDLELPYP